MRIKKTFYLVWVVNADKTGMIKVEKDTMKKLRNFVISTPLEIRQVWKIKKGSRFKKSRIGAECLFIDR